MDFGFEDDLDINELYIASLERLLTEPDSFGDTLFDYFLISPDPCHNSSFSNT